MSNLQLEMSSSTCEGQHVSLTERDPRRGRLSQISHSLEINFPQHAVEVKIDDSGGDLFVAASQDLHRGDKVLECFAAGIAIDAPHRRSRCGFCACATECEETSTISQMCRQCGLVAFCRECRCAGAILWHERSGECNILRALVLSLAQMSGSRTESVEWRELENFANQVDSLHVLTVRLMCRRWYDLCVQNQLTSCSDKVKEGAPLGDVLCSNESCHSSKKARIIENNDSCQDREGVNSVVSTNTHMPAVDWNAFDALYSLGLSDEQTREQCAVLENLCKLMRSEFSNRASSSGSRDCSWVTKEDFEKVLGKCAGCGHAVTDLTLPLGKQCLGRALYIHHSFYNHSCAPNAFLSCNSVGIKSCAEKANIEEIQQVKKRKHRKHTHVCALQARVHCLKDLKAGNSVTLSYIPTSGLDRTERQTRLEGYQFRCECRACSGSAGTETYAWEVALKVPDGGDIDSLREIQFSCNETLLKMPRNGRSSEEEHALGSCIAMLRMMSNGIRNQGIPLSHEVCLEMHRLTASALSLSGEVTKAVESHRRFFEAVVEYLFDPIALASQKLAFAGDLESEHNFKEALSVATEALQLSRIALGSDHAFSVIADEKVVRLHQKVTQSKSVLACT
mmetsp:Transcript_3011/g.7847  ORF Transcript_3011/g.7847 Transcript_3011/m.7847 type:complete len:623 (-) Transcript_3011:485-2353(-)|eukprot:CAMPEP_0113535246 /NCGR_PEP_ID=MMETSP0015_2-20120614/5597_1 /TAXON_ID=2838 /ORGANISM="Odontella" /LENGTH=622 /DNA_ID=CAMNT_0000434475 /DNA_START=234 /DNA_END=2102 /DNA_ORIENTATION=+ /assembly_acc=CAM_ASM_000160